MLWIASFFMVILYFFNNKLFYTVVPFFVIFAIIYLFYWKSHRRASRSSKPAAKLNDDGPSQISFSDSSPSDASDESHENNEPPQKNNDFTDNHSLPESIQQNKATYSYEDVDIIPVQYGHGYVKPSVPLSFFCREKVEIWSGQHLIGYMRDNRLSGMVRDWISSGKYIIAYCRIYAGDDTYAQIAIAF